MFIAQVSSPMNETEELSSTSDLDSIASFDESEDFILLHSENQDEFETEYENEHEDVSRNKSGGTEMPCSSREQEPTALPITTSMQTETTAAAPVDKREAYSICENLVKGLSPRDRKRFFPEPMTPEVRKMTRKVTRLLAYMSAPTTAQFLQNISCRPGSRSMADRAAEQKGHQLVIEKELKVRASFEMYKGFFPDKIWKCCSYSCFASNVSEVELVHALFQIHKTSKGLQLEIKRTEELVEPRRRGVGCSNMAFTAPTREMREEEDVAFVGTNRQKALDRLSKYVRSVLPFLSQNGSFENSSLRLTQKLCSSAIAILLDVSLNFLYKRKKQRRKGSLSDSGDLPVLQSLVDRAGTRQRQFRRTGDRRGYPRIEEMSRYECGCDEPCFSAVPESRLKHQYDAFIRVSRQLAPRRKERQYLLNIMFCPLSNSVVKQCDQSIAKLFTLSVGFVNTIRTVLERMCTETSTENDALAADWQKSGYNHTNHPANRMDARIRERIENHLHMVLRPDPSGGNELSVCRVYSPEINTHEKLRKLLRTLLSSDKDGPVSISRSSMQRRINEYLVSRKLRISYQQTDHNACPTCKTLKHACFQFFQEHRQIELKLEQLLQEMSGDTLSVPAIKQKEEEASALRLKAQEKKFQEEEALSNYESHRIRDRDIRTRVKQLSDHFRDNENKLRRQKLLAPGSPPWCSLKNHGIITHQDDMTKVDLPYFVESASADITRWRFDVNAHVSAVNGDATVFSHEQGTGAKTAGCIMEEILLDHILRCRGETIKIIVSDNASVGKNWLSTIALPQYFVDQGFAEIVLVVFLENNHGKWLADLLFGQLQTKRKRTTLLSIDDLLNEFECINRRNGRVQGFALNPLSSIDFASVLSDLGYQTKPPKEFSFVRCNIHFAGAARAGAKMKLSGELKELLAPALPDEVGMVRISSDPLGNKPNEQRKYEQRYFDVPAASITRTRKKGCASSCVPPAPIASTTASLPSSTGRALQPEGIPQDRGNVVNANTPLVVPLDKVFAPSGAAVVASRTARHVGFNGISFRKSNAFPELKHFESDLVRRAWPPGLIQRQAAIEERSSWGEGSVAESLKCAPENWVARRPSFVASLETGEVKARYPPRNLLNAIYERGPRASDSWIPTRTYPEPPFPIVEGTCASNAMKQLSHIYNQDSKYVHVLHVLKMIFQDMGRSQPQERCDKWLQNRVTVPSESSITRYLERLDIFCKREETYPSAPLTVRQAFKQDSNVIADMERRLKEQNIASKGNSRKKELNKMFGESETKPGALEKFEFLVERDLERFARELKEHKRKQAVFDEAHGLLPREN